MRIGILLIATGNYTDFLTSIIEDCDKYLLSGHQKNYHVFWDSGKAWAPFIQCHQVQHKPWPYVTLNRYAFFMQYAQYLKDYDYLYYIDVDMRIVAPVGDEILGNLVAVQHPGYYGRRGTPETRWQSMAYIPGNVPMQYFAGGFQGGANYLQAAEVMAENIRLDTMNGYTAIWHDESHWNKYLTTHSPDVILSPSYCYAEGQNLPFEQKIIALNKDHKKYQK